MLGRLRSARSARRPRGRGRGLPALVAVRTAGTWRGWLLRNGGPGPPALASQPRPATCVVRRLGLRPGTVAQDARDACTTRHGRRQARPLARHPGSRRLHRARAPLTGADRAATTCATCQRRRQAGTVADRACPTCLGCHGPDRPRRMSGHAWSAGTVSSWRRQRLLALPQVPAVRAPAPFVPRARSCPGPVRAARSDPRRQPAPRASRREPPPRPAPAARTARAPAPRARCPARTRTRPSPSPAARRRCPEA